MRWKRRRLLIRALRKRHQLTAVTNRTDNIAGTDILAFVTLRNEIDRLPGFLAHHRRLGVQHFLIVDNGSDDGSERFLAAQCDVSVWKAPHSYKQARFGLDWLTLLLMRYGHGHWCLTLDADEMLVYPHWESRNLTALTTWLDEQSMVALPAMMLDLYPKGKISAQGPAPESSSLGPLEWFDKGNYMIIHQKPLGNLWIQGGVRARVFFAENPRQAPTLNKIPLVRWNRRYIYANSTHSLYPARLNAVFADDGGERISGVLLHRKFLPVIVPKSQEEKARREHFGDAEKFDEYYDRLSGDPDLWCEHSTRFTGWRQIEAMGLMSRGGWI
jgi:glycosyltransferase involved in cell wall biosynthesis